MDLTTNYMGFHLKGPLVVGAGPMSDTLDRVKRVEDAGASAVVLRSLFEEQITAESMATHSAFVDSSYSYGEATTYLPEPEEFVLGPHEYLEHLRKVKQAVGIPVFASLNGTTPGGWLEHARLMEQAGADALELNLYFLNTDAGVDGATLEGMALDIVRTVRQAVRIPLSVKLSPFFSSLANMGLRLGELGADGLVLYNRYYAPDVDLELLQAAGHLTLSTSRDLLPRLRWLAILHGQVESSLAVTGGVHTAEDVIKAMMCGADAVQIVSALLLNGPEYLLKIRAGVEAWLHEHEYENLRQLVGSMSLARCPNPQVFQRGNYMHLLQAWE